MSTKNSAAFTLRTTKEERENLESEAAFLSFGSLNQYVSHLISEREVPKELVSKRSKEVDKPSEERAISSKTSTIGTRITADEKRIIREKSQAEGISESVFLRRQLRLLLHQQPAFTHKEIAALRESNTQVVRVGRNLNQVVKRIRSSKAPQIVFESTLLEALLGAVERQEHAVRALIAQHMQRLAR